MSETERYFDPNLLEMEMEQISRPLLGPSVTELKFSYCGSRYSGRDAAETFEAFYEQEADPDVSLWQDYIRPSELEKVLGGSSVHLIGVSESQARRIFEEYKEHLWEAETV